jgi:AraC-like DNA-binding protein
MKFELIDIVSILIIYQSFMLGLFLLFNKKAKPLFIRVLIIIFLLIIFHFSYMLFEKCNVSKNYFFGPFFGLLYGPMYYIYTKSLIIEKLHFVKISYHFIPAFLILFTLIFFNSKMVNLFSVISLIVTIHFTAYLILSLRLIFKYRKLLKHTKSSFYDISLFWLELIIYLQLFILFITIIESYFRSVEIGDIIVLLIFVLVLILINCLYYLGLKQVRLFRGFNEEKVNSIVGKAYTISDELFNEYVNIINNYIITKKPYLEFEISLKDLSESLSISKRNLSHVINKEFDKNFYDFINHYRLEKVKNDLLKSNNQIKEIMYLSGFSNKATFNLIFKKNTGLTPTQYREKYKS